MTPRRSRRRAHACCGRPEDGRAADAAGTGVRLRLNLETKKYELDPIASPTPASSSARADEEGSRSKERYFSPRDKNDNWDVGDQPPEFWNQFKTDFAPGTHVRIHPLLDWTELNIWEYIKRERIPTVSLYYDQGTGTRYRSLGCAVHVPRGVHGAHTGEDHRGVAHGQVFERRGRAGRAQDKERRWRRPRDALRRDDYM